MSCRNSAFVLPVGVPTVGNVVPEVSSSADRYKLGATLSKSDLNGSSAGAVPVSGIACAAGFATGGIGVVMLAAASAAGKGGLLASSSANAASWSRIRCVSWSLVSPVAVGFTVSDSMVGSGGNDMPGSRVVSRAPTPLSNAVKFGAAAFSFCSCAIACFSATLRASSPRPTVVSGLLRCCPRFAN